MKRLKTCLMICLLVLICVSGKRSIALGAGKEPGNVLSLKAQTVSETSVRLRWSKASRATGYYVYRIEGDGDVKRIASTTKNSYTVTKLKVGKKYTYKVYAYRKSGKKTYRSQKGSPSLTVETKVKKPAAPSNFRIASYGNRSILLKWSKVKEARGYIVYQFNEKTGRYKRLGVTKDTSYRVSGLKTGTTYQFVLKSYRRVQGKNAYSKNSKEVKGKARTYSSSAKAVHGRYFNATVKSKTTATVTETGKKVTLKSGTKVTSTSRGTGKVTVFLKNGAETDPQTYNIRNLSVIANAYAELSVGYSHDMSDLVKGLSIGGRVKLLAGLGRGDLRVNNLDLTMSSDVWNVRADATGYLMLKGMDVYKTGDRQYGSRFDSSQIGLAGMGAAMDLGAEYRLYINSFFDYIKFSAAVTDLGFLSFSSKAVQKFQTSGNVEYTGVNDIQLGQDMNLQETFNGIKDQFLEILDLQEVAAEKVTSRIRPQLFVGVELPILWDNMCVGLLYNAKFGYTSTRNELTLALNARPKDWINFGVNYSMLNTWKSLGWILEFIPKSGVGFFIGSDYFMLQRAKLPVGESSLAILPVNQANFNLRFGFHIAMGKNY